MSFRVLKWQRRKQNRKNRNPGKARPGQERRRCLAGIPRGHENDAPRLVGALWVRVITAVLRRGFVREDFVVGHVVKVQIVACWTANDWWVHPKIAD